MPGSGRRGQSRGGSERRLGGWTWGGGSAWSSRQRYRTEQWSFLSSGSSERSEFPSPLIRSEYSPSQETYWAAVGHCFSSLPPFHEVMTPPKSHPNPLNKKGRPF